MFIFSNQCYNTHYFCECIRYISTLFQKVMYLWIGRNCHPNFLTQVLGVPSYAAVPDNLVGNLMLQQLHLKSTVFTCCGHCSFLHFSFNIYLCTRMFQQVVLWMVYWSHPVTYIQYSYSFTDGSSLDDENLTVALLS